MGDNTQRSKQILDDLMVYIQTIENENSIVKKQLDDLENIHNEKFNKLLMEYNKINEELLHVKKESSSFSKVSHIITLENENNRLKEDIELLNARIKRLIESSKEKEIRNKSSETLLDDNTISKNQHSDMIETTTESNPSKDNHRVVDETQLKNKLIKKNTFTNPTNSVSPTNQDNANSNNILNNNEDIVSPTVMCNTINQITPIISSEPNDVQENVVMNIAYKKEDQNTLIMNIPDVYEKTIKGKVYYVEDTATNQYIYEKKEDESVGDKLGEIIILNNGRKKISWF